MENDIRSKGKFVNMGLIGFDVWMLLWVLAEKLYLSLLQFMLDLLIRAVATLYVRIRDFDFVVDFNCQIINFSIFEMR